MKSNIGLVKRAFKSIFKPIYFGVSGQQMASFNRATIFANCIGFAGLFVYPYLAINLQALGFESHQLWHTGVIWVIAFIVLTLNYNKQYLAARLLVTLSIAANVIIVATYFGKAFNGYHVYFVGLFFSIFGYSSYRASLRTVVFMIAALTLPIVDLYTHQGVIPVTNLDPRDFPVGVLWTDTIAVVAALSLSLFIEKNNADDHEQNLEKIVAERTEELLKAKLEIEKISIQKSQFVANTSHELRTPMQSILGNLALIQKRIQTKDNEPLNPEKLEKLKTNVLRCMDAADRMAELQSVLLELTRFEDGDISCRPTQFDLVEQLQSQIASFSKNPMEFKSPQGQLTFPVHSDKVLLSQISSNLLQNAEKYANPGSTITVDLKDAGHWFQIEYRNEGVGIPEEEIHQIFEPFTQSSRTDDLVGGVGLGLTLSTDYATALGGELILKDFSPENTVFVLKLPKLVPGVPAADRESEAS